MKCVVDGCNRPSRNIRSATYCAMHRARVLKYGRPDGFKPLSVALSPQERFDVCHTKVESGCWIWTQHKTPDGYGVMSVRCKAVRAHRWAYERYVGPIPRGLHVCHTCDTPSCVNPEHLFLGTPLENERDKCAKGRQARGEKQHLAKLSVDQVQEIRASRETGRALAKRFSVTPTTITDVRKGRTWKHVGTTLNARGRQMIVWGVA